MTPLLIRLQIAVFALVWAAFAVIYLTQPVLPVLQREFGVELVVVSLSVSAVIFGIALANLPFGILIDRVAIGPVILAGGAAVAGAGLVCALTQDIRVLISARFLQGLFLPALTTCIAAFLARTLPVERLRVVMGTYVSAQVFGGLSGRLLGGWLHPPLHWRGAFVTSAILVLACTLTAWLCLPRHPIRDRSPVKPAGYLQLLARWPLIRVFIVAFGGFFIFSSLFNYLPFRLASPPFSYSTAVTTMLYLVFILGIVIGPLAGRLSNRFGGGVMLIGGSLTIAAALVLLAIPHIAAVTAGLLALCAGFFTLHTAAVGLLNTRLTSGHGHANALYVLFYYLGGWSGITCCGFAYQYGGWNGVLLSSLLMLLPPLFGGLAELRHPQPLPATRRKLIP